jgi:hypothetical protein
VELINNQAISKNNPHGILLAKFPLAAVFVMPHRFTTRANLMLSIYEFANPRASEQRKAIHPNAARQNFIPALSKSKNSG